MARQKAIVVEEEIQEKPDLGPRAVKGDRFGPYHTIRIMKSKDDPKYMDFTASGTLGPGKENRFSLRGMIERGRDVQNVPDCVLGVLRDAIETRVRLIEKPVSQTGYGEEGHETERSQSNSYDFAEIETYETKRPPNAKYGHPIYLTNTR